MRQDQPKQTSSPIGGYCVFEMRRFPEVESHQFSAWLFEVQVFVSGSLLPLATGDNLVGVALGHGLTIAVLVISMGHIRCEVCAMLAHESREHLLQWRSFQPSGDHRSADQRQHRNHRCSQLHNVPIVWRISRLTTRPGTVTFLALSATRSGR